MINPIDKILTEWAYRVNDGMPNAADSYHLVVLQEVLDSMNLPNEFKTMFLPLVREAACLQGQTAANSDCTPKGDSDSSGKQKTSTQNLQTTKKTKKNSRPAKGKKSKLVSSMSKEQQKTADDRDKGVAGAGGETASQGESRYSNAVDNLDYDNFKKKNKKDIDTEIAGLSTRKPKYPSEQEIRDLAALGLTPNSPAGMEYIATREVFAEEELKRIQKLPKPNVYYSKSGFNKKDGDYKDWMKAAFDGALATQQLLDESQMDTSQPHVTIQSTTAVDNKVEDDLKQQTLDASEKCKGGDTQACEDVAHYYKELESFKHYRKYHDTYVLGVDDKGRTFVVHISNKKGSDMKDPQNNTTPAQRFEVMKKDLKSQFGEFSNLSDEQLEQVATAVSVVIEEETKKVVDVQQTTIKDASTTPVDDDFVEVAEIAARKYIHGGSDEPGIVGRGEKRKRQKNSQSDEWPNGKPSKGHEFGAWLEDGDPPISAKDWADMSTKDKIKVAQKFLGDESFHAKIYGRDENGNSKYQPPYAMAKVFIKVGEVAQGGHRELKKIRKAIQMASIKKHNPKLYAKIEKQIKGMSKKDIKNGKDKDLVAKLYAEHKEKEKWPDGPLEADSVKKSGEIKQKEADTVSKAHENVVKKVTNEDKAMGYPKVDKNGKKQNGPHTVGYIGTVMDALHFDAYIDEEDDGKMIIQMGINGAKPSHIRDCLAQKTGFTGDTKTKEGREALKLHIRNSCEIDATSGGIVIKGKDGAEDTQLMDDTWRTAGTSQKVASGYGKDMRDCVTKGVAADRNGV